MFSGVRALTSSGDEALGQEEEVQLREERKQRMLNGHSLKARFVTVICF